MAKRSIPVTETPANPVPTLTAEAPQALLAEVAALRAAVQAKPAQPTKGDSSAKNEMAAISAFKKKGFGIVKPKVDVLTFNLWVAQGLRPKEGEHATKVANLRLFHKSQCRKLTAEEAKGFAQKFKEAEAKRSAKSATVTALHQPSA